MATTTKGVPYPLGTDNNDAATDMQAIATWLDDALGAKTTAQINSIAGTGLWTGRTVFNSDTGDIWVYRGVTLGWCIAGGVVGGIVWMADTTDPPGHLYCNGAAYNTTTYANLFSKIGGEFGSNLPDLRNRFVAGLGGQAEFDVIGETGGVSTVTLSTANLASHTHTGPSHTHTTPNHTHSITHDHPSFNISGGAHTHSVAASFAYFVTVYTGGGGVTVGQADLNLGGIPAGNQRIPFFTNLSYSWDEALITSSEGGHTHSVDVPSFSGNTPSGGGGSTGASGSAATGSAGSGTPFSVLNPYIMLKPYIKY